MPPGAAASLQTSLSMSNGSNWSWEQDRQRQWQGGWLLLFRPAGPLFAAAPPQAGTAAPALQPSDNC